MSNEKIVDRIKKLIALSTSSNENEAAVAAAKAQELLAQYNLDLDEVMRDGRKEFITTKTEVMDTYAYLRGLGMAVARAHFCRYYFAVVPCISKSGNLYNRERHCFVGLRHNAEVALLMFEYLQTTVFRLARESAKKKAADTGENFSWSYVTGFQNGACYRLAQRLHAMVPTAEQVLEAPKGSNLPALLSLHQQAQAEVDDYVSKSLALVKKKPRDLSYDSQGLRDGNEAGKTISLNTQVGNSKQRRISG